MYTNFSLFLVVLIAAAAQSQNYNSEGNARVLNYNNNVGEKNYEYSFDTENQIHQDESGYWTGIGQAGPDGEELGINNVQGHATYVFPEGSGFSLSYNADGNGYRPKFVIGSIVGRHQPPAVGFGQGSQQFSQQSSQQFNQQSGQRFNQQSGQRFNQQSGQRFNQQSGQQLFSQLG